MNIIVWIIFGAIAGWVASVVTHRSDRQGMFGDILLGIVGAAVGGFLMYMIGQPGVTGFNLYSFAVSTFGAVAVIWIARRLYKY